MFEMVVLVVQAQSRTMKILLMNLLNCQSRERTSLTKETVMLMVTIKSILLFSIQMTRCICDIATCF